MQRILPIIIAAFFALGCNSPEKIEEEKINALSFSLEISNEGIKSLESDREQAIKNKVLTSDLLSWVKADLIFEEEKIPVKVRLKGDWPDHLKGHKWSLRVKVKSEEYVLGMKEFSFQAPETRGDLNEWVYHKFLEKEDILTTKYEFCNLSINGVSKGVFALEEHFTKLLLERQKRREGPIVKFNEDPLWQSRVINEGKTVGGVEFARSASVDVFSAKKTYSRPTLNKQYNIARNLLYQEQFMMAKTSDIYDVDRLAKFLAITDITKSYHGWYYHNQRWYYNGVTGKLEPIGFDGYMGKKQDYWDERPFLGYINEKGESPFLNGNFSIEPFKDSLFVDRYFYYLEEYFSISYLDKLQAEISNELLEYQELIGSERADYKYDNGLLAANLAKIKERSELKNHRTEYMNFPFQKMEINRSAEVAMPVNNASIVVYRSSEGSYDLLNVHYWNITIKGIGDEGNPNGEEMIVQAYKELDTPSWTKYINEHKGDKIYYTVEGIDSIFWSDIIPQSAPKFYSPMQELLEIRLNQLCKVQGNKIVIPTGEYSLSDNIIIPKGYEFHIEAGTVLDMINGAKIISYSPVYAVGTKEKRIKITSSDSTANGFTVLQANKESHLEYVEFSKMNTLNYKGWILTGSVSFYESDVSVSNCAFVSNQCEDALNIIRSTFVVDSSLFKNVFSDAFDGDFCVGKVLNSTYENIGNDAIDFSGSDIYVENCIMTGIGDKGISIGENSSVEAVNTSISGAAIGVSAKDLSTGKIHKVNFTDCKYGFAIYQKKPEFGPASIVAKSIEFREVKNEFILDKSSKIELNGAESTGSKKIEIDALFY